MSGAQLGLLDGPPVEAKPRLVRVIDGLRPYQREAVEAIFAELATVRGTMLVLFTGAGKTRTCGAAVTRWLAEHPTDHVLWLAERDFLLEDARERLEEMTGEYVSVEKADWHADNSRVVVGSVQTMKGARLKAWRRDYFGLIVYDEAHHAVSPRSRAIFDHFEGAKIIGPTATPRRLDKIGMWNVFQSEAFTRGIDWGVDQGYFCPIIPKARLLDSVDLSGVNSVGGDLNLGQLESEIAKNAAAIARLAVEEMEDRPTIIYTPGVASARAVTDTLNQIRDKWAVYVDADTEREERRFARREFGKAHQWIVNCAIFMEGLDVPAARGIVIARPTKSQALYIQMAGRGGRPEGWIGQLPDRDERIAAIAASGKPNFKLLDITGHPGRHSLVHAVEALSGKPADSPQVQRAKVILQKLPSAGLTIDDAMQEAARQLAEEEEINRERVAKAAAKAQVKARHAAFNPFKRFHLDERPADGIPPEWSQRPATPAQIEWLKHNRLATKDVTYGVVESLKAQARRWHDDGRATFRQRNALSRYGYPVDLSFAQASRVIGEQNLLGYMRRLTPDRLAALLERKEAGEDG